MAFLVALRVENYCRAAELNHGTCPHDPYGGRIQQNKRVMPSNDQVNLCLDQALYMTLYPIGTWVRNKIIGKNTDA